MFVLIAAKLYDIVLKYYKIELYQQTTFNYRTDRYCKRTTVINGVTIPKGAIVTIPISLLQHSPLYWKDPEKFDPDRYFF